MARATGLTARAGADAARTGESRLWRVGACVGVGTTFNLELPSVTEPAASPISSEEVTA